MVRRAATAAVTALVALCAALAVPVAQLRPPALAARCCCPVPARCRCPDHAGRRDGAAPASLRACHRDAQRLHGPPALPFVAASAPALVVATRVVVAAFRPPASPHAAPPEARPAAPS